MDFKLIKEESNKINSILDNSELKIDEKELMLTFIASRVKLKLNNSEMNGIWLAIEHMYNKKDKNE